MPWGGNDKFRVDRRFAEVTGIRKTQNTKLLGLQGSEKQKIKKLQGYGKYRVAENKEFRNVIDTLGEDDLLPNFPKTTSACLRLHKPSRLFCNINSEICDVIWVLVQALIALNLFQTCISVN